MEWWHWIVLGLALLFGEVITPGGFYILFFGIGALIVGGLAGLNLAGPAWFQVVLFSVISIATLWLFRERLLQATQGGAPYNVDSMVGETAVIMEEIPGNGIGKAEMRGTSWNARNIGQQPLARGERCRVERIEGLTLIVRHETV
jgi:membrane protein implicated in regulation of membrane protease activity